MRVNPQDKVLSCLSDERLLDLACLVPKNPMFPRSCARSFAQDIIAGVTNNSGGSFLRNESFTPQGNVLAGSNDNTSSDAGFGQTIIVNSPQRGAVGSGNAQTTPSSSTVTIVN